MSKPSAAEMAAKSKTYMGRLYSEMDCQAFVEAALALVGIHENLAGSNAWYRRMTWVGTPEECKAAFGCIPVGAFLFIHEYDGNEPAKYHGDGMGNASHIGIKTGEGEGAIHSSSSKGCVCESKFKDKTIKNGGWNKVGLWDALAYDGVTLGTQTETQTPAAAPETVTPVPTTTPAAPTFSASTATVTAANGKPVKMRARPTKSSNLYWEIPVGTVVTVCGAAVGPWTPISWGTHTGYMMTEFLSMTGATAGNTGASTQPAAPEADDFPEFPDDGENGANWAAEVYDLTREQAEALLRDFPMAHIFQTHG